MAKRLRTALWAQAFQRGWAAIARNSLRAGIRAAERTLVKPKPARRRASAAASSGLLGIALGAAGARRFKLYRPPSATFGERLPLLVILHGCGQDANAFAASTRMNTVAARERFCVLYVEQDRLANPQGCWNWFGTDSRRAYGEAAQIIKALDQVCMLHSVDRARVAIAGLSAGASMAALVATRYPERFKAVAMHSCVLPGTAHSTLSGLGAMHGRGTTRPLAAATQTPGRRLPPLLVIHGSADAVVSPRNGRAATEAWAEHADARPLTAREVQRGARYPMAATEFKHRRTVAATLVEVAGLGHACSGGAAAHAFSVPRGLDASRLVWAFAARQFRAEADFALQASSVAKVSRSVASQVHAAASRPRRSRPCPPRVGSRSAHRLATHTPPRSRRPGVPPACQQGIPVSP
jgi:poly(hydroxyalkanoate) depolymerase family esterase